MLHALKTGETIVLEATSNQVNQDGGYTGMQPKDFCALAYEIADKVGLAHSNIILGGDHLGPNCWQHLTSDEAMSKSDFMIREYVKSGFRKIHLDCSMSCFDDPTPLGDDLVADRAARLCAVAEATWKEFGGEPPVYIVGTEVPVPGGAQENLDELALTSVEAAKQTIEIHQKAFADRGLASVWPRVIGLVVQPGVEFDHHKIIAFQPEKAVSLSQFVETQPHMVFEAHSTDYQSTEHLTALVKGHFAILKVGPWLTFAMREAFWALDHIEQESIAEDECSNIRATLIAAMKSNPEHWQKYYSTDQHQQNLDVQFSLSDRIRYYWPVAEAQSAISRLMTNFDKTPPPLTLISQYMPAQYKAVMNGEIAATARELILHRISEVLEQYSTACYDSTASKTKD